MADVALNGRTNRSSTSKDRDWDCFVSSSGRAAQQRLHEGVAAQATQPTRSTIPVSQIDEGPVIGARLCGDWDGCEAGRFVYIIDRGIAGLVFETVEECIVNLLYNYVCRHGRRREKEECVLIASSVGYASTLHA